MNPFPDDPPPASALFADRRPGLRTATLEELDQIVENSSEKNRNFFIAYLGLLIYVQAIVFSTTDLQLLTGTELKLPIVDLNVPLVGFYVVVPIFVIALHFNFLQNLESHHYKLMRWQDAHPGGKVPRSRIQPFLFDYATLETGSQLERWVRWANSLLVLNLAPITLGLLLWRYTDRQEAWVTVWHYLAFCFDAYLVWKLRVALRRNRQADCVEPPVRGWRRWLSPLLTGARFIGDVPRHGLRGGFGLFLLAETLFTVAVSVLPSDAFRACCLPLAWKVERFQYKTPFLPGIASLLLPRIAMDPSETVWRPDQKSLEVAAKMAGESDWVKYFNEHGTGFRPSTSNLRLAELREQNLPRAQLRGAKLDYANLAAAHLQGADLWAAHLQGADLGSARLQGANLAGAQLQGADLGSAGLEGAVLGDAQLQGADLGFARLQGAVLGAAQLQGTVLEVAQLQGADLKYAQLQGANLWSAQLQGANLRSAQLQGAYLGAAQLRASDLGNAELQGADLGAAQLQGARLWKTGLWGATPPKASGVFLHNPPFVETVPDWKALTKLAVSLPEGELRIGFLYRLKQAESRKNSPASQAALTHDPGAVYRRVLPDSCQALASREHRLAELRGIRGNYRDQDYLFGKNPDFRATLIAIERTLCTLSACADLRDDIEGLDCRPFPKAKK